MALTTSFLWLLAAEFFFYLSGYVVHMGAGRILGPEDYGRYGLVLTLALLVANLIGNGIPVAMGKLLSEAVARQPGAVPAIKRQSAYAQTALVLLVTLGFWLAAPLVARAVGDSGLADLFRLSALIIPFYGADAYYFYYFSGVQAFRVQSLLKLLRAVLRVTVILGLTYSFHLNGIIAGYVIVPLVVFLVAGGLDLFRKKSPLPVSLEGHFPVIALIKLGIPVTVFLVLFEILMSFDLYLLKMFQYDDQLIGWYNAALTIARIPTFLFYALTIILLPTIAESVSQANGERVRTLVLAALRFMLLLSVPMVALLIAYRETMMTLLFGSAFREAAQILPPLLVATGAFAFLYVFAFVWKGAEKIHIPIIFALVALVVNVLVALALVGQAAPAVMAAGKALTALVVMPYFFVLLSRSFQAVLRWRDLSLLMLLGGMLWGAAHLAGDTIGALLVMGPLLCGIYVFTLTRTGLVTTEDWRLIFPRRRMEWRD